MTGWVIERFFSVSIYVYKVYTMLYYILHVSQNSAACSASCFHRSVLRPQAKPGIPLEQSAVTIVSLWSPDGLKSVLQELKVRCLQEKPQLLHV